MKDEYYIGIDVGGTNIKAGGVSEKGELLVEFIHRIGKVDRTEEGIVNVIKSSVREVERKLGGKCAGVGVGLPGFIDIKRGVVTTSPNYPEWKEFPAREMLKKTLKRFVLIDNDANLFAVGEGWMGAGKGMTSFMGVTLGTGVGAGIVLNGEIWHGADGSGGEFGHITVNPFGPRCRCGNDGCVEAYLSSYGLLRLAEEVYGKSLEVEEAEAPKLLHERARKGDKRAVEVFEVAGRMLGIGLASVANLLNLEGIIIGGGTGRAFRYFLPGIKKEMRRAQPLPRKRLRILKSRLFERANILGGVYKVIKCRRRKR